MNSSEFQLTEPEMLRRIAQVGQANIAAVVGVSPTLINDWVSGKKGITLAHIPALLEALDLAVYDDEVVNAYRILARKGIGM